MERISVRSKGPDIVFRSGGRRCRIGSEFVALVPEVLEKVPLDERFRLQFQDEDGEIRDYDPATDPEATPPAAEAVPDPDDDREPPASGDAAVPAGDGDPPPPDPGAVDTTAPRGRKGARRKPKE